MKTKKERELFATGVARLLRKQINVVGDYRVLAEMLDGLPVGRLLDWIVMEEEAHHRLLVNIIHSLGQTEKAPSGQSVEIQRESMLYWVKRLRKKERTVVAICGSLRSQACGKNGNVVDGFLDALLMDGEKHQTILSAVEKAIENLLMSRPQ